DLVVALVLEDPPWRDLPDQISPEAFVAEARAGIEQAQRVTEAELVEWSRAVNPQWAEEEHGPWARAKLEVRAQLLDKEQAWRATPWEQHVAAITAPTLLLVGNPAKGAITQ